MKIRNQMAENGKQKVNATVPQSIIFSLCLLTSVFSYAEDLPDPTRPPANLFVPSSAGGVGAGSGADSVISAVAGRGATQYRSSGLHTIIISESRRAAIIDGQTVELGGQHGNAQLVEVNEGNVVLQRAQSRQVLTLFPDVKVARKDLSGKESTEKELSNKELQVDHPSTSRNMQHRKHKTRPTAQKEEE